MSITEHISEHQTQETSHSFQTNNNGILQENSHGGWENSTFGTIQWYRKLLLCDANTKRMIHLSSKTPEAKVSSSFVSLKENLTPPRFGCIISHSFSEVTFWALLDLYPEATYDKECKMWHVPANKPPSERRVVLLSDVSYSLVVACDNTSLWFLNYCVWLH